MNFQLCTTQGQGAQKLRTGNESKTLTGCLSVCPSSLKGEVRGSESLLSP